VAYDKSYSQIILLRQELCWLSMRAILIDIFLPQAAAAGANKSHLVPWDSQSPVEFASCLILASVYSGVLLGLQLPLGNTASLE